MFKISKKIIYAIEAVIDIAYHTGEDPIQNIDIAKRQGIPKRYLEQTLQSLVRNSILVGSRGPKGGYRLAKEKRKIKISDIILSVQHTKENNQKNKVSKSETYIVLYGIPLLHNCTAGNVTISLSSTSPKLSSNFFISRHPNSTKGCLNS